MSSDFPNDSEGVSPPIALLEGKQIKNVNDDGQTPPGMTGVETTSEYCNFMASEYLQSFHDAEPSPGSLQTPVKDTRPRTEL